MHGKGTKRIARGSQDRFRTIEHADMHCEGCNSREQRTDSIPSPGFSFDTAEASGLFLNFDQFVPVPAIHKKLR